MIPVVVKNCAIGEGKTKIILPIVAVTQADILKEAAALTALPLDVVEWRIDWYEDGCCAEKVAETAAALQKVLGEIPLLITFRTAKEGGERDISTEDYRQLMTEICACGAADLVDVELFLGDEILSSLAETAHAHGVKVVASSHEWKHTPSQEEIVSRLCRMQELGADILKIAVTPTCSRDVITLLSATEEMASCHAHCPLITMSMGGKGVITRLVGESFGSAMTFGAGKKASAPGQVGARELDAVLTTIHNSL